METTVVVPPKYARSKQHPLVLERVTPPTAADNVEKPTVEVATESTDYAQFLRTKITRRKIIDAGGNEVIKVRETKVLSEEGKKAAKQAFNAMVEGGFDALQERLTSIKQQIKENDKLPVAEQTFAPDQRLYYQRLLKSCEMQNRNNRMAGIKQEFKAAGNGWERVIHTRAQEMQVQRPQLSIAQAEAFARNSIAGQVHKNREQLVRKLEKSFSVKTISELRAIVRQAEQQVLQETGGQDARQILEDPRLFTFAEKLLTKQNTSEGVITAAEVTTAIAEIADKERGGEKGKGIRARLAAAIGGVVLGVGMYFGGDAAGGIKNVLLPPPHMLTILASAGVVEDPFSIYFNALQRTVEEAYGQANGLQVEEKSLKKKPVLLDTNDADLQTEPLGPSVAEVVAGRLKTLFMDGEVGRCMTIGTLTSPEFGNTAPVVVYNGTSQENVQNECRKLFPRLSKLNLKDKKVLQASTLRVASVTPVYKKAHPDTIYTQGMENGFLGWRQIDGTCFLTAVSTILANIADRKGEIPLSPYVFSELLSIANKEQATLIPENSPQGPEEIRAETPGIIISDFGVFNTWWKALEQNKPILDKLGVEFSMIPIDNAVNTGADSQLLNLTNRLTTTEITPAGWRERGHILAKQYRGIIQQGGHPIFISEVFKGTSHALAVVGVEVDDSTHESAIIAYEPANIGVGDWEYTKGHWENIPGTRGIVRIPLDEFNLRTINQAPVGSNEKSNNHIVVFTEKKTEKENVLPFVFMRPDAKTKTPAYTSSNKPAVSSQKRA